MIYAGSSLMEVKPPAAGTVYRKNCARFSATGEQFPGIRWTVFEGLTGGHAGQLRPVGGGTYESCRADDVPQSGGDSLPRH